VKSVLLRVTEPVAYKYKHLKTEVRLDHAFFACIYVLKICI